MEENDLHFGVTPRNNIAHIVSGNSSICGYEAYDLATVDFRDVQDLIYKPCMMCAKIAVQIVAAKFDK